MNFFKRLLGDKKIAVAKTVKFSGMDASGDKCVVCGAARSTHPNTDHKFSEAGEVSRSRRMPGLSNPGEAIFSTPPAPRVVELLSATTPQLSVNMREVLKAAAARR